MNYKTLLFVAFCLIYSQVLFSQTVAETTNEKRKKAFEQVWSTVNEKHFDPTFGGVDWKNVRKIYEPKALKAKSDNEFHAVLRQMLGELKLSHFNVFPASAEVKSENASPGKIGFEIKIIENKPIVSRVEAGTNAEKNGVKQGFILNGVDGKSVAEILKNLEENFISHPIPEQQKKLYGERVLMSIINGEAGSQAKYSFLNAENKQTELSLIRQPYSTELSQPMGNFPAQEVFFESKMLENNIGYIYFNMWLIPQMPKIRKAVSEMLNTQAIIFDLRGNPGGVGGMASGIAGLVCSEETSLGTMKSRNSEMKFAVYPQKDVYKGKILILTDYGSASTSEVFAAGMQDIGRATIIGETSAGAVLPSVFVYLPTGAIFQYAMSDYKSPKKVLIENRGVKPDIEVHQTRSATIAGKDLLLETAINLITKGN